MFSKLTSITSARCANSSTECGEKQTRWLRYSQSENVGNANGFCENHFPYLRQIEALRQIFGFIGAGKLNLNSLFFDNLGNTAC